MTKRKSTALRLSQTQELIAAYEEAGLGSGTAYRFMNEMEYKLSRKKGFSKRQREWLDRLIEEGVPAPKGDRKYIAKINSALEIENFDDRQILLEFKGKLIRGWELSEKQKAWCDRILEKADNIKLGNHWVPDEQTIERMKLAVKVSVCYNNNYWNTHGGGWKALCLVKKYLDEQSSYIDEFQVQRLFKAVTGKLKEMEKPKFNIGDKCYVPVKTKNQDGDYLWLPGFAIIIDGPKVTDRGQIAYDVLADGQVITTTIASKRKK